MSPLALLHFEAHPLWTNLAIFAAASAVVWLAGTKLSHYADVISKRTGLGQAFVGLLLLATATSLPEVATTVTATFIGSVPLVVGNLLGGVSMQTAILALLDAAAVSGGALTRRTPQPALLLQGLLLVLLLTIALTSIALGGGPPLFHVGAGTAALFVVYLAGVYFAQRYERHPRWQPVDPPNPTTRPGERTPRPTEKTRSRARGIDCASGTAVRRRAGSSSSSVPVRR